MIDSSHIISESVPSDPTWVVFLSVGDGNLQLLVGWPNCNALLQLMIIYNCRMAGEEKKGRSYLSHNTKIKFWFNGLELSFYEIWHLRLESAIASCDTSNKTGLHPSYLISGSHFGQVDETTDNSTLFTTMLPFTAGF